MNKSWMIPAFLLSAAVPAWADEMARVLSATPVTRQVPVIRQVCPVPPAGSGQNAVPPNTANVTPSSNGQPCVNQTFTENQTVAWNVVYELGGRPYSVQMPYDPGATVRLQAAPTVDAPAVANVTGTPDTGNFAQTELGQALALPPGGPVPAEEQITYDATPGYAPLYGQPVWPYYGGYAGGWYGTPIVAPYAWPIGLGLGFGLGWYSGYRGGYYGGGYYPRPQPYYRGGYGYRGAPGAPGGGPGHNAAPGARAYGGTTGGYRGYGGGGGYSGGGRGGGGGGRYR